MPILTIFTLSFNAVSPNACGQEKYDTLYYVSYQRFITSRFYFSRKFTSLEIKNAQKKYTLEYKPNTTLNMGVGATYKWATLNLAYGFGFLNPDRGRGDTKYLDLQFHTYGRKFILDIFGQFYKGFYLSPKGYAAQGDQYYLRPDLKVDLIGTSMQYVMNHRQFSYRASFLQNEWQKKSAGTLLLGVEAYVGWIKADSTVVPTAINNEPNELHPQAISFFEFGPNVGYAHTFVIKKHFFVTGSASVSLDYGRSKHSNKAAAEKISGFSPNTFVRFCTGYNSNRWGISAIYIRNGVSLAGDRNNKEVTVDTGNFRLNYIYRFFPGKKARKALKPVTTIDKKDKF